MRLFFAVPLSPATRSQIADAIAALKIHNPPWRWVATDNLHVTMKFLGETPEADVPALAACAQDVAAKRDAFDIKVAAPGGFPNLKRPRVLFFEVDTGTEAMRELATSLDRALFGALGIPQEKRPFRSHITIARLKSPLPRHAAQALSSAPPIDAQERIDRFVLMQSHLGPKGAKYQELKEFALSKAK